MCGIFGSIDSVIYEKRSFFRKYNLQKHFLSDAILVMMIFGHKVVKRNIAIRFVLFISAYMKNSIEIQTQQPQNQSIYHRCWHVWWQKVTHYTENINLQMSVLLFKLLYAFHLAENFWKARLRDKKNDSKIYM